MNSLKRQLVLGIDQAKTKFGCALIDYTTYEAIWLNRSETKLIGISRIKFWHKYITNIIQKMKPFIIGKEGLIPDQGAFTKAHKLVDGALIAGPLEWWLHEHNYDEGQGNLFSIESGNWKKICLGNGRLKKSNIELYLKTIKEITGMDFANDDIADAYFLAKTAAIAHKLNHGIIKPWDLPKKIIEGFLDSKYCRLQKTGISTIANRIHKDKDEKLFQYFSRYSKASWGRLVPLDPDDKFGPTRPINEHDEFVEATKGDMIPKVRMRQQATLLLD